MRCCVIGCQISQYSPEYTSFHRLFCKGKYNKGWLDAIRIINGQTIDEESSKNARICTKHFEKSCVIYYGLQSRISPGAVPTIFPKSVAKEMERVDVDSMLPNDFEEASCSNPGPSDLSKSSVLVEKTCSIPNRKRSSDRDPLDVTVEEATPTSLKRNNKRIKDLPNKKSSKI